MKRCPLGFDADDVATALGGEPTRERNGKTLTPEHLAACDACRGEQALREGVRATWRDASARDDRSRAVFREQRLARQVRPLRPHSVMRGHMVVAGMVGVAFAIVATRPWRLAAHGDDGGGAGRRPEVALHPSAPAAPDAGRLDSGSAERPLSVGESGQEVAAPVRPDLRPDKERPLSMPALPRSPALRPPAPAPPVDGFDPTKEFARGLASLAGGNRAAAEHSFRLVADSPRATPSLRDRADFRWAELALARNENDRARAELSGLMKTADLDLAADASFLLARSAKTAAERAEIWATFLARRPRAPYREDALLERAAALLAAGQKAETADILAQLETEGTLTKAQTRRLAALAREL